MSNVCLNLNEFTLSYLSFRKMCYKMRQCRFMKLARVNMYIFNISNSIAFDYTNSFNECTLTGVHSFSKLFCALNIRCLPLSIYCLKVLYLCPNGTSYLKRADRTNSRHIFKSQSFKEESNDCYAHLFGVLIVQSLLDNFFEVRVRRGCFDARAR